MKEAYGVIAEIWDEMMKDQHRKYLKTLDVYLRENSNINVAAELACGTGALTLPLLNRIRTLYGIDRSREMIDLAKKRAAESRSVHFYQQDMLDLKLPEKCDFIFCLFDGISYLSTISQLQSVFAGVYQHLTVDGRFLFDFICPDKSHTHTDDVHELRVKDHLVKWSEARENNTIKIKIDIRDNKQEKTNLFSEIHKHYLYTISDIGDSLAGLFEIISLEKNGFRILVMAKPKR